MYVADGSLAFTANVIEPHGPVPDSYSLPFTQGMLNGNCDQHIDILNAGVKCSHTVIGGVMVNDS